MDGGPGSYRKAKTTAKAVDTALDAAKSTKGVARVLGTAGRRNMHYGIEIEFDGVRIATEQLVDGDNTVIAQTARARFARSGEIMLDNAAAAQNYQKSMIGKNLGSYDKACNSCSTHVGEVLRAGGAKVSTEHRQQFLDIGRILKSIWD